MIKVESLTKRYQGFTAIENLSFEVGQGEIVGFLGPNGAGKSTTMRILTGYMPASSGRASIAGFDVFEQSIEARKRLGYLPESTPLPDDLRVCEYLAYRAALKGVPSRDVRKRVLEVIGLCNLEEKERSLVRTLSKGQKQRVGLADALVHDPQLLILDEPTIGLDPIQIRQVRELIKNLAHRRTVLISTHILPEVEIMCSRVVVVHKGRIRASDTPENLINNLRSVGSIQLTLGKDVQDAQVESSLSAIAGVRNITTTRGEHGVTFQLKTDAEKDPFAQILELTRTKNWNVVDVAKRRASLEDVFVDLTSGN
jgi:ABC-2 type transport system ATP-binding protein